MCLGQSASTGIKLFVSIILSLATLTLHAEEAKNPYAALTEITTITEKKLEPKDCTIKASVDFQAYQHRLNVFRQAWLNRDFSYDFYAKRGKQVLAFILLKNDAELFTEGLYNGKEQSECHFSLDVVYYDKFGQEKKLEALTWRFNNKQAKKINWEKFDPKDFHEIALDYKLNQSVMDWVSDEPGMSGDKQPPQDSCDMTLFRANAIFIRATTFCRKNYMDSEAGYAALAGARKCMGSMNETETKSAALSAIKSLDQAVKQHGRGNACNMVEGIARDVMVKAH